MRAWLVVVAACGGAPTRALELDVDGAPTALWYRDGDGPWQPLEVAGPHQIDVTDDYLVLAVCARDDGWIETQELAQTVADVPPRVIWTDSRCEGTWPTLVLDGTMDQPGTVFAGINHTSSNRGPWSYALAAPLYAHGLIAVGVDRVAIVDDASPTSTPVLDVSTGLPLVDATVTAPAVGMFSAGLSAGGSVAKLSTDPTHVRLVDPAQLSPQESEWVELDDVERRISQQVSSLAITIVLPPPLGSVAYADDATPLVPTSLPPYTQLDTWVMSGAALQLRFTSRAFVDATAPSELGFDRPPGYDPAWAVDTAHSFMHELEADLDDGTSFSSTETAETLQR